MNPLIKFAHMAYPYAKKIDAALADVRSRMKREGLDGNEEDRLGERFSVGRSSFDTYINTAKARKGMSVEACVMAVLHNHTTTVANYCICYSFVTRKWLGSCYFVPESDTDSEYIDGFDREVSREIARKLGLSARSKTVLTEKRALGAIRRMVILITSKRAREMQNDPNEFARE